MISSGINNGKDTFISVHPCRIFWHQICKAKIKGLSKYRHQSFQTNSESRVSNSFLRVYDGIVYIFSFENYVSNVISVKYIIFS